MTKIEVGTLRYWALLLWHVVRYPVRRFDACSWCGSDLEHHPDVSTDDDATRHYITYQCSGCKWWDALPERWEA